MTVEELLVEEKIEFKVSPADFVVRCLHPEHDDNNPSMRIDRITGMFNCFSCGFKGNIFKHFNKPANYLDIKREALKQKIEQTRSQSVGLQMPKDILMYTGNERGIKKETYQKFKAFISTQTQFAGRIVFPVYDITGKIVAFNGRILGETLGDVPKYILHPPKVKLPLYPADVTPIKGRVILVEGIYDVINLHDKGLTNALCCFGTHNVNEQKLQLLKMRGVEQIDIIFDPDPAGQDAVEKVKELCDKAMLKHYSVKLTGEKGIDPGKLSESAVLALKEQLYA